MTIKKHTKETKQKIFDLVDSGLSRREVGEIMGMTKNAIIGIMRDAGKCKKANYAYVSYKVDTINNNYDKSVAFNEHKEIISQYEISKKRLLAVNPFGYLKIIVLKGK